MSKIRLGLNAKLYIQMVPDSSHSELIEVDQIKDLTLSLEKAEFDSTTRANGGWRSTVGTLKSAVLEFNHTWVPENIPFAILRDSFLVGGKVRMHVLDSVNGEGLIADFECLQFKRDEGLENALTSDVVLKPTFSDFKPIWKRHSSTAGSSSSS